MSATAKQPREESPIPISALGLGLGFFGLSMLMAAWRGLSAERWAQSIFLSIPLLIGAGLLIASGWVLLWALRIAVRRTVPGNSPWTRRVGAWLWQDITAGNVFSTLPRIGLAWLFLAAANGWPLPFEVARELWAEIVGAEILLIHAGGILGAIVLPPSDPGWKRVLQWLLFAGALAMYVVIAQSVLSWFLVAFLFGMTAIRLVRILSRPRSTPELVSHAMTWGVEFFVLLIVFVLNPDVHHGGAGAAIRFGAFFYPPLAVLGVLGFLNVDAARYPSNKDAPAPPAPAG